MIEAEYIEKKADSSIFHAISTLAHEQIVFCHDKETSLRAIIAIHNTVLGPAIGGIRMWDYANEQDALQDVLRLSRGMTYKSAIAGLHLGGGKSVIIGNPADIKNESLLRRFGQFVHTLGGRYWTAKDMNIHTRDVEIIRTETPYVLGLPKALGGSGNPSPMTAYGVFIGIKAACKKVYGRDELGEKSVLIQGVGSVGHYLIPLLHKSGAKIYISDTDQKKLQNIAKTYTGIHILAPEEVYHTPVDIFAPCALGAILNDETIPQLKCHIVAGAANNQLEEEEKHASMLQARDILFAPDFLINAGGIIQVYYEYTGNYKRKVAQRHIEHTYDTLMDIFQLAEKKKITTHAAAVIISSQRIDKIQKIKHHRCLKNTPTTSLP